MAWNCQQIETDCQRRGTGVLALGNENKVKLLQIFWFIGLFSVPVQLQDCLNRYSIQTVIYIDLGKTLSFQKQHREKVIMEALDGSYECEIMIG